MKILFPISAFYPAQVGGPCNSVYNIAKGLVSEGISVYVVTTNMGLNRNHSVNLDKIVNIDGMNVIYSSPSFSTKFTKVLAPFSVMPKNLSRHIKEFSPDIIHLSSFFDPVALFSAEIARKNGIKCILSPRGEFADFALDTKKIKKEIFFKVPWVKKLISSVELFHVTSNDEGVWLSSFFKNRFPEFKDKPWISIPNMVDDEIFYNNEDNKKTEDFGKYILSLGKLSREKNIESLIKAFSMANIDEEIKLYVAGGVLEYPDYVGELKKLVTELRIENRVVFGNKRVEGEEKRRLYRNAEVFVFPSIKENFGMVAVEALAQKLPVIASKGTPWRGLIENKCGYWVEHDPTAIKNSLEKYFSLKEVEKNEMKENAVKYALEFSIKILIKKYVNMYEKITNKIS